MSIWNYIALGLCLGLLAFLLWKEWRRADRSRLAGRVVATLVTVAALACMTLPIDYALRRTAAGERVLLTEGYDADSVRAFLRLHPGTVVDTAVDGGVLPGAGQVAARWHVFGYGLTGEEWAALRPAMLDFHAPGPLTGIVSVDWRRRLNPGEKLLVQGRWAGGAGRLLLVGMGSVLDSANVKPEGAFSLSFLPAQMGKAVYRLVALAGKDTLEQEELPVETEADGPLKILLLASSPDFENRFLLNWLSKDGHQVASRTTVSRGKAQEAFVNRERSALTPLTPALLGGFDLVIADASALPGRGTAEWTVLRRQVEEKGLGLLIKVDSAGQGGVGIGGEGQVEVDPGKDSAQGLVIRDRPGLRALVRDSLGRMLVASCLDGAGKLVFSTLNTSYSRLLAGERQQYAAYWSNLLQEAAGASGRMSTAGEEWSWKPGLPRVGEPVVMELQTAAGFPQGMIGETAASGRMGPQTEVAVYLAQDAVLPFYWRGRYWPGTAGWQTVYTPAGDTAWWYAWPAGAWKPVNRERRRVETLDLIRDGKIGAAPVSGGGSLVTEKLVMEKAEFPKWWFYGFFLLGALFLWVERKMGGMSG